MHHACSGTASLTIHCSAQTACGLAGMATPPVREEAALALSPVSGRAGLPHSHLLPSSPTVAAAADALAGSSIAAVSQLLPASPLHTDRKSPSQEEHQYAQQQQYVKLQPLQGAHRRKLSHPSFDHHLPGTSSPGAHASPVPLRRLFTSGDGAVRQTSDDIPRSGAAAWAVGGAAARPLASPGPQASLLVSRSFSSLPVHSPSGGSRGSPSQQVSLPQGASEEGQAVTLGKMQLPSVQGGCALAPGAGSGQLLRSLLPASPAGKVPGALRPPPAPAPTSFGATTSPSAAAATAEAAAAAAGSAHPLHRTLPLRDLRLSSSLGHRSSSLHGACTGMHGSAHDAATARRLSLPSSPSQGAPLPAAPWHKGSAHGFSQHSRPEALGGMAAPHPAAALVPSHVDSASPPACGLSLQILQQLCTLQVGLAAMQLPSKSGPLRSPCKVHYRILGEASQQEGPAQHLGQLSLLQAGQVLRDHGFWDAAGHGCYTQPTEQKSSRSSHSGGGGGSSIGTQPTNLLLWNAMARATEASGAAAVCPATHAVCTHPGTPLAQLVGQLTQYCARTGASKGEALPSSTSSPPSASWSAPSLVAWSPEGNSVSTSPSAQCYFWIGPLVEPEAGWRNPPDAASPDLFGACRHLLVAATPWSSPAVLGGAFALNPNMFQCILLVWSSWLDHDHALPVFTDDLASCALLASALASGAMLHVLPDPELARVVSLGAPAPCYFLLDLDGTCLAPLCF